MGGRDRRKLREALRDGLGKGRQLTELGRADSEWRVEPGGSGLPSRAQQTPLILAYSGRPTSQITARSQESWVSGEGSEAFIPGAPPPPTPGPGAGPWAPFCLQGQSLWAVVSGKGPQTPRCSGLQCALSPGQPGAALGATPPAVTKPTSFAPDWWREWEAGRDRPSGPHPRRPCPVVAPPAGAGGSGTGPGCGRLVEGKVPRLLG